MNFTYLSPFPELKKLMTYCQEAEEFVWTKPAISATSSRRAMEFMVKMIYIWLVGDTDRCTTFEMLTDVRFTDYVADQTLISSLHYIRKMGNVAVHQGDLSTDEAMKVLEELHFVVGEFCILLGLVEDYPVFVTPSASTANPAAPSTTETTVTVAPELVAKFAPRMRDTRFQVHYRRNEGENRTLYLQASLREAGWPLVNRPNQAMPCAAGLNMMLDDGDTMDYILYGRDNRPLAVIEYTTTSENIVAGRARAIAKAKQLEAKYGYKPIAYYTNGYHIYVIDQLGYKPRRVFQFHSIEELELLKLRAGNRQDISVPQINEDIAGRDYQKNAITAACRALMDHRRRALLVMATGTGKTRVSIALSDVLLRAGWVKNILFLADRTSLVRQAHKNFTKLLPNVTTSVYAGGSMNRDANARIIFSTYQTMIKLIEDDTRAFGIGRFDLIIIDEAHRSIFKKYGSLFHYFDSLMIGLTATPRSEDAKSTYEVFEVQDNEPDFAYELEQAIADGFLVGFSVLDKTTDALRRGVFYDELSDEEKKSIEEAFEEISEDDVDYSGLEINQNTKGEIINLGTIDVMLNDLMKNGLKIDGGDYLGKTIIFAKSHLAAEKIVERFRVLYPYLGDEYCKLIDCQVQNSQGLIDSFGERDQLPQIAVSVDMLDTGIDVPDVLNLVFFKNVHSKIKFLQMIGRGTRLCDDVFGPGMHKQGFLIFDYYDNFRYFRTSNSWSMIENTGEKRKSWAITPQSVLIHKNQLAILRHFIESPNLTAFEEQYKNNLKQYFIRAVQGLCNDDIEVQYNMAYVSKYRTAEQWDGFTDEKQEEIETCILPLLPPDSAPSKSRTFDLLIYVIEANAPDMIAEGKDIRKLRHGFQNVANKMNEMMEELSKLKTIPEIQKKEKLIKQMMNCDLLMDNFSFELCEQVREELRDLMVYIPTDSNAYVIHTHDFLIEDDTTEGGLGCEKTYPERAREYIDAGSPVLSKIRNLDDLTQEDKDELENVFKSRLGNEADYAAWSGNKPLLSFLRVQVGIADEAIETKFGSFLNANTLDAMQLQYTQQIISYTRENGDISFLDLQRVSPFCDIDIMSLFGAKISHIKTLINGLHRPIL